MTSETRTALVIQAYQSAFLEPLMMRAGDLLRFEFCDTDYPGWCWCMHSDGKCGWVPRSYLDIEEKSAIALQDYDGTELSVQQGETLNLLKEEAGWFWASTINGQQGWIPGDCLKMGSPRPSG